MKNIIVKKYLTTIFTTNEITTKCVYNCFNMDLHNIIFRLGLIFKSQQLLILKKYLFKLDMTLNLVSPRNVS